jgi:hypothetical protein
MSFTTIGEIVGKEREQRKKRERESEKRLDDGDDIGSSRAATTTVSSIPPLLSSLSSAEIEELPDNKKAAIAYKLYNQGKTPVDVTSTLSVPAREALVYYRDFWRLKNHYELYRIYPEIQPYLSTFVKLFKELKRQGLNPNNVKWFVDCLNIGTIKMEDICADYEDAKANHQNLLAQTQSLRDEKQSLQYENQDLVRQIEHDRRIFENESKAMQQYGSDLSKLTEQQ